MIEQTDLSVIIEAIIAFLLAVIAIYNKKRTDSAAVTATATTQTAMTNQVMAMQPTRDIIGTDTREPGTTQIGSQYWMNAGYTGEEPDTETKRAYSDAQRAYDSAVLQANALIGKYGDAKVSAGVKSIATVKQK
jgi:hypothetical protein